MIKSRQVNRKWIGMWAGTEGKEAGGRGRASSPWDGRELGAVDRRKS